MRFEEGIGEIVDHPHRLFADLRLIGSHRDAASYAACYTSARAPVMTRNPSNSDEVLEARRTSH